jgi:cyclohexanecarboxylate-CoA ligase
MGQKGTILTRALIDTYTQGGFWQDQFLFDFFQKILERTPDKVAVVDRDYRLTFREIGRLANNLTTSLQKLGIRRGSVVAFELPNWYHTVVLNLALTRLGALINPIVPIYKEREVSFILKQAKAEVFIIPDTFRNFNYVEMVEKIKPNLPDLKRIIVLGARVPKGMTSLESLLEGDGSLPELEKIEPNDVKLLLYTSGTTAEPKGVQHTHNTLVYTMLNDSGHWGVNQDTVVFMPSPVTHISGYAWALEIPLIIGCGVVLMDIWNAEKGLELMEKEKCTFIVAATPFLQGLLHSPNFPRHKIPSFLFVCGGAYIPPELIKEAWAVGWKTYRVYGSTEAPTITLGRGSIEKASETDGFVKSYECRIVDFENRPLPYGQEGEIVAKGPKTFVGYKNPALNEDSFDNGGWFHTGDIGRLSADGYIEITGRKKDIIIRGGENISVKEIEDLIHLHPSVETAAVVAMPDKTLGEKVCTYIKLRKGTALDSKGLNDFLRSYKLAKQKLPERLEIIEEFPMTPSGKIKKHELRKDVADKLGLPPVRI